MRALNFSMRVAVPATAIAIAIGFAGMQALAQSAPSGANWHGAQGGGASEIMAIVKLRHRLNLSDDQSAALDAILANARTHARALHAAAQPTLAQIAAELANAQPNLQTLAQLRDSLQPQRDALRKATRDQLIAFYATLSATQQQVVIDALRKLAAWQTERVGKYLVP